MSGRITENPRMLADNINGDPEKKRKSHEQHEVSKCCVVMRSSNSKEQQLLETAAFHLILLRNPLQESYNYNKGYDSDGRFGNESSPGAGVRMMMRKKRKQDSEVEGIVKHNDENDANLVTSSSSSSSYETIKSGISSVSMEENEVEDDKRTARRLQQYRLRSIVDIYHDTRPL